MTQFGEPIKKVRYGEELPELDVPCPKCGGELYRFCNFKFKTIVTMCIQQARDMKPCGFVERYNTHVVGVKKKR